MANVCSAGTRLREAVVKERRFTKYRATLLLEMRGTFVGADLSFEAKCNDK